MKIIHAIPALMLAAAVSCSKPIQQTADYNVVPLPQEITPAEGPGFLLSSKTVIAYPADNDTLKRNAELMAEYFKTLTDNDLKLVTEAPEKDAVVLKDDLDSSNPEAYQITVNPDLITINGASAAGNFYGIQTLRKAVPSKAHQNVEYPAVTINDAPRFGYRGAMFDVARHFFPVDSVKQFIDMLALHNVNTLHWHLSDDQGWRIEIKKRPGLTEIGSKRSGTCIGHNFDTNDSIPYGGFYTQEEAKEIVKYAADRHITVIPEIDLPGHMLGALSAYPELGCTGGPYEVWTRWGVADDVLCAGNDSTYQLIDDVLTEITEVFPSKYIHIGGDESPKVRWEKCPKCQAKIKELGLKSDAHSTAEQKLQTYVMDRATKTLNKLGRNMIGWDEVLEGGPVEGGVIMSWRGTEGAVTAVKSGMKAILSPTNYCYFDYTQALDKENEPLGIEVPYMRSHRVGIVHCHLGKIGQLCLVTLKNIIEISGDCRIMTHRLGRLRLIRNIGHWFGHRLGIIVGARSSDTTHCQGQHQRYCQSQLFFHQNSFFLNLVLNYVMNNVGHFTTPTLQK